MSIQTVKNDYKLARYRYVLEQKQSLNANTITIVTIYQAGLGLIVAGQFSLLLAKKASNLSSDTLWLGSHTVLALFVILTIFSIVFMASGITSWLHYREEEALIEFEVFRKPKSSIRFLDILRWYETYILISMLVIAAGYFYVFYKYAALFF